jgi:hypothetical protein
VEGFIAQFAALSVRQRQAGMALLRATAPQQAVHSTRFYSGGA